MALRIVRLGSPREPDEGLRLGTVRRPPRGVPKAQLSSRNFFDLWFPNLAPSEALLRASLPMDDQQWPTFRRQFMREMKMPGASHDLRLVASLSRRTDLSLGCYCEDEQHCHRAVLRELLEALDAQFA